MTTADDDLAAPPRARRRREPPRSAHAAWAPAPGRDPVAILEAADEGRLSSLRALRWQRIAASPFALLRGSAAVMAADLATVPSTDLLVQAVGDAHLANFGVFATTERRLVFDLNDFDETARAPFEWDVKRLVVSVLVCGRSAGLREKDALAAARAAATAYHEGMARIAELPHVEAWYLSVNVDAVIDELPAGPAAANARAVIAKARKRTAQRAVARHTVEVDGRLRLREDPPLIERVPLAESDLLTEFARYLGSLPIERRVLLERYRPIDLALKVVGVGSVGTRCMIVLLEGRDARDTLILQAKEAGPSVLEAATGHARAGHHGQRVVEGQRILQAAGDPFLGWSTSEIGRDFYWRQLWDMKGSVDLDVVRADGLHAYAQLCGTVLARGHARAGDADAIAAYMGRSDRFDRAITDFAAAYADQVERDHQAVAAAAACITN